MNCLRKVTPSFADPHCDETMQAALQETVCRKWRRQRPDGIDTMGLAGFEGPIISNDQAHVIVTRKQRQVFDCEPDGHRFAGNPPLIDPAGAAVQTGDQCARFIVFNEHIKA